MTSSRLPAGFILSRKLFLGAPLAVAAAVYGGAYLGWAASGFRAHRPLVVLLVDLAFVPLNLASTYAFLRAARRPRIDPSIARAFQWLSLALAMVAVGNLGWGLINSRGEDPTFSWANLPFLLFYPMVIAGFLSLARAQRRRIEWRKLLLDSAIVLLSMAFIVWFFVVRTLLPTFESSWRAAIGLAYPVGDLAVLVLLLSLLLRASTVINPAAYRVLVTGFALNAVSDLAYDMASQALPRMLPNWADALHMVSYVLILWGAELYWRRPALAIPGSDGESQTAPPASSIPLIAASAAGVLVVVVAIRESAGPVSILAIGMVALSALLIVRESLAVRENARLLSERAERASSTRFEALVRYSSDVVIVVDAGLVTRFVSPSVHRVLGVAPGQWLDQPLRDLLHPDDRAQGDAFLSDCLLHPSSTSSVRWRLRHASGDWRALETLAANLLTEPSVRGVVLTLRDVTERDLLEEQLRQAQKMEAIGQLAGGVAHDFNNLLTTVLASSDMALAQLDPGAPARDDIEEIRHAAARASALTGQLLALSRKQMVEPRTLDLARVIGETSRLLERLLGEQVWLVTRVTEDLGAVRADRGQVEQVLLNLAVNARDAMPGGGTLTMRASNVVLETPLTTRFMDVPPGEYVLLEVQDTGAGMDEATLPRIFEPFFTTKPRGKGTGLGLASVYGIVRQGGGAINVDSTPGQGTTFRIYLPRVSPDTAAEEPVQPARAEAGTETILLVEDEPALMGVGQRILQTAGYTVLAAHDAEDALRQAATWSGPIDLLLTDVIMPGETGPVLAHRLVHQRPELRVLYMSGYAGDELGEHGVLEPGVALLQKPFTARDLAARVRETLGEPRSRLREEIPQPG